eukprot:11281819-Alexandrium_andersonii.AAC.1
MTTRVLVDAVPHGAGDAVAALPVDDRAPGFNSRAAPQVVLVGVGLLALSENREELADRSEAGE